MQYYRCACGHEQCWSSMGIPSCRICSLCSTTLAESGMFHHSGNKHEVYAQFFRGKLVAKCKKCDKICDIREALNLEDIEKELSIALEDVRNADLLNKLEGSDANSSITR